VTPAEATAHDFRIACEDAVRGTPAEEFATFHVVPEPTGVVVFAAGGVILRPDRVILEGEDEYPLALDPHLPVALLGVDDMTVAFLPH